MNSNFSTRQFIVFYLVETSKGKVILWNEKCIFIDVILRYDLIHVGDVILHHIIFLRIGTTVL